MIALSSFNSNQMERKSRTYVLLRKDSPLSLILRSQGSRTKPLLYFDGKSNRALRYSPNQKSPYEDSQDGNIVREPIIFEDGMLHVPETNLVLQEFMSIHPDNGRIFVERDAEKEASEDLDRLNYEADAIIAARNLELDMMETIARVVFNTNTDGMTTSELKRDVAVYARRNPKEFMDILKDPLLKVQDTVAKSFNEQILRVRNKNRDIFFNLPNNKSKLMTIPFGENKILAVARYLQTDDGIETLKLLNKTLKGSL